MTKVEVSDEIKELLSGVIGELEMFMYHEFGQESDEDCEKLKEIFGLKDIE